MRTRLMILMHLSALIVATAGWSEEPVARSAKLGDVLGDVDHLAFRAVEARRNGQLSSLLREGLSANLRASDGTTLLMYAARHGDSEAVRTLLEAGANPNIKNETGETALFSGVSDPGKVRYLVKAGADVDAATNFGSTPLLAAAGNTEASESVDLLLKAGAKIATEKGWSPLFAAAKVGNFAAVKVLLEHYRDQAYADPRMSTALTQALRHGHEDIATHLLKWDGPGNLKSNEDVLSKALKAALSHPLPEFAHSLLEQGALPNEVSLATQSDVEDVALVAMLIERGADIRNTNKRGETALDQAKLRGHHNVQKMLEQAGVVAGRNWHQYQPPRNDVKLSSSNRREVITTAVRKSLALLYNASDHLLQSRANCSSCHHQDLPLVAGALAMSRGIDVPRDALERINQGQLTDWKEHDLESLYALAARPNTSQTGGYLLWGRSAMGLAGNGITKAVAWHLAATQLSDGSWHSHGPRMPIQDGSHQCTALALRALRAYPLAARETEFAERVERAASWLEKTPAKTHTNRAFRLLGLAWSDTARPDILDLAIKDLLKAQNEDGSWSQLVNLEGDAWATGLALLALHTAGIESTHPGYQRGVRFLLETQFEDGAWFVRSRSHPVLPHFDSHFPFGKHQWISAAGTAVATASLALALEPVDEPIMYFTPTGNLGVTELESLAAAADRFSFKGERSIDFKEDIAPIFEQSCIDCHGSTDKDSAGSFSVANRESFMAGGQSRARPVLQGNSEQSPLIRHVTGQIDDMEMPPLNERDSYPALTQPQVKILRTWIDEGAHWPKGVRLVE